MKKHTTLRALAGLLVVLALVFTAGATSAFVGAKPFYLDAPLRFDYIPKGAGDKPILATDLDGNYVQIGRAFQSGHHGYAARRPK